MKSWDQALRGALNVPTVSYLNIAIRGAPYKWESTIPGIIKALQCVAAK